MECVVINVECVVICVAEYCGELEECETLTDDSHEGVEVSDVETLSGHVDEELDHLGSLLLLGGLQGERQHIHELTFPWDWF